MSINKHFGAPELVCLPLASSLPVRISLFWAEGVVALFSEGRDRTAKFATAVAVALAVPFVLTHEGPVQKTLSVRILSWHCHVRNQEAGHHHRISV